MRSNIKKFLTVALVAILTLPVAYTRPVEVGAQSVAQGLAVQPFRATPTSAVSVAADTEPAIAIRYVGTSAAPKVAIEADGNLTFTVGGSAYTGFECPVSGALGGVIDVSDAACNTFGEVVDIINADTSGSFKAVLLGALRSDSSDAALLADAADTDVTRPEGEIGFWDSSAFDDNTVVLLNSADTEGIKYYLPVGAKKLVSNPFKDTVSVLTYASENITNAGTVGDFDALCVTEVIDNDGSDSTENVRVMYREAGAATTVTGKIDEFNYAGGGLACDGGKIIVRIYASGADTSAVSLLATGYRYQKF